MSDDGSLLKISVAVLSQLTRYLERLGIDAGGLMRSVGLEPGLLSSPDGQIPIEGYIAMENEAARLSGDPCFGLHMGESLEPGNYSILGYVMMNSGTLGEALGKAASYYRIIGNLLVPSYQAGIGKIKVILAAPKHAPAFSRHCFEAAFSGQVAMMRGLSGRRVDPLEVGFTFTAPQSDSEYRRVFNCPVLFGRGCNYIVLDARVAGIPVLQPNKALLGYFEEYAKDLMAEIDGQGGTTAAVMRIILERLSRSRVSVRTVASELAMSPRSLQERLKKEGRAFSDVLDQAREGMAKRYLRDSRTVEEVAFLLGYSNAGVFRKAFKKWSGQTPKGYRRSVTAGGEA